MYIYIYIGTVLFVHCLLVCMYIYIHIYSLRRKIRVVAGLPLGTH